MIKFNLFLIALELFFYLILFLRQVKGALLCLRPFFATGSLLKMIKNDFHSTSKALSVLKIIKFSSRLFGHVSKQVD